MRIKELFQKAKKKIVGVGAAAVTGLATTGVALATETGATELTFNFEPSEMFSWTNMMLEAMMPVVYITLGISLCFIIVGALKSAFRG